MTERWSSDRPLDADGVERAVRAQGWDVRAETVTHLGSGWDYDAYLVDEEWVIRFPRRAEVAAGLAREEAILDFVACRLASDLAVPHIELHGSACEHFPYPFFGHRSVPGVWADDPTAPPSAKLAAELGAALSAIHSIPVSAAADAGVEPEVESMAERLEETRQRLAGSPALELVPDAAGWVFDRDAVPAEFDGEPRVIHNDICPDHLIVERTSGRLVGIIDWSDIATGDPVLDFVVPVLWRGRPFVDDAIEAYSLSLDDAFTRRLDFLARTLSVKWLADAIGRGGDVDKHLRWVRNTFAVDRPDGPG